MGFLKSLKINIKDLKREERILEFEVTLSKEEVFARVQQQNKYSGIKGFYARTSNFLGRGFYQVQLEGDFFKIVLGPYDYSAGIFIGSVVEIEPKKSLITFYYPKQNLRWTALGLLLGVVISVAVELAMSETSIGRKTVSVISTVALVMGVVLWAMKGATRVYKKRYSADLISLFSDVLIKEPVRF